jgi:hypothetical protein
VTNVQTNGSFGVGTPGERFCLESDCLNECLGFLCIFTFIPRPQNMISSSFVFSEEWNGIINPSTGHADGGTIANIPGAGFDRAGFYVAFFHSDNDTMWVLCTSSDHSDLLSCLLPQEEYSWAHLYGFRSYKDKMLQRTTGVDIFQLIFYGL